MSQFIDLETSIGMKVSISARDSEPETCRLLGDLEHQTVFRREELLRFAREVIATFGRGELTEAQIGEYLTRGLKKEGDDKK